MSNVPAPISPACVFHCATSAFSTANRFTSYDPLGTTLDAPAPARLQSCLAPASRLHCTPVAPGTTHSSVPSTRARRSVPGPHTSDVPQPDSKRPRSDTSTGARSESERIMTSSELFGVHVEVGLDGGRAGD